MSEESAIKSFEDLEVWKRGCQLAVEVCVETHDSKMYALRDQMQRAAISIPSNIAEGVERDSTQEYIRFARISKGSTGELRTQLYVYDRVCQRLNISGPKGMREMISESRVISKMLQSLINALRRRAHPDQPTPPKR